MLVTTNQTGRFQPVHRRTETRQRQVHCIALGEAASGLTNHPLRCTYKEISMSGVISRVQSFLISEDGPTAVEYAVMLALILVACISIVTSLGSSIKGTFSTVNTALGS